MPADFQPFWDYINERHAIYLRKTILEGKKPLIKYDPKRAVPDVVWTLGHLTNDPILAKYRFTNVFRELDRVTVWIREHIREPYADHPNLWFMLAIARKINWPPALRELMDDKAWPDNPDFRLSDMTGTLMRRKARGEKVETGAYMITAATKSTPWGDWPKQKFISEIVLGRLWEDREQIQLRLEGQEGQYSLQDAWELLQIPHYTTWGPFMSFQVVLDWRHTRYLNHAPDRSSWAAVGPGSKRGLNRLYGRSVGANISQGAALVEMQQLLAMSKDHLKSHVPPLEMEDIQNSLCETDKYLRVKTNGGEPRARYVRGRGY